GPMSVDVSEATGELIEATSLQPSGGATVAETAVGIAADPNDPAAFEIIWIGSPCEHTGSIFVDESTSTISIQREVCTGGTDAIGLDRIVRLRFSNPVSVAAWRGTIGTGPHESVGPGPSATPGGSGSAVAFRLSLANPSGDPTLVDVVDLSGHATNAV